VSARALAVLLALAALAIGVAGCGDDDEEEGTTSVPDITVPKGEVTTTTEATTDTVPDDTGGTSVDPEKPDSPANDLPPEPDTPEARFEEFCEKNPGACG
jgi:hypothetical protein